MKERSYQKKMLDSESRVVLCNWKRGSVKTQSILNKIINEKTGEFAYISRYSFEGIKLLFKEYSKDEENLFKIIIVSNKIVCEYKNGDKIEVLLYHPQNEEVKELKGINMVFFDDCFPTIDFLNRGLKPMGIEQIFVMISDMSLELIDDKFEDNNSNYDDFIDYSIAKLKVEFDNLQGDVMKVKERSCILDMIAKLESMKKID